LCRGDIRRHWIAIENKWLATRYGLRAMHIRTPSGKRRLLSQDLADVLERIKPISEEFGDAAFLKLLQPTNKLETGAERQRKLFRESGNWKSLVEDMTTRWVAEL
jgi:carboxylate-amine ligase